MDEYDLSETDYQKLPVPRRMPPNLPVFFGGGALVLLVSLAVSVRVVPPASVGVQSTLGSVAADTLESGLHLCNPRKSALLFEVFRSRL